MCTCSCSWSWSWSWSCTGRCPTLRRAKRTGTNRDVRCRKEQNNASTGAEGAGKYSDPLSLEPPRWKRWKIETLWENHGIEGAAGKQSTGQLSTHLHTFSVCVYAYAAPKTYRTAPCRTALRRTAPRRTVPHRAYRTVATRKRLLQMDKPQRHRRSKMGGNENRLLDKCTNHAAWPSGISCAGPAPKHKSEKV